MLSRCLAFYILGLFIFVSSLPAQEKAACLACHGEKDLSTVNEKGENVSLYVNDSLFLFSAHGTFNCIDCHSSLAGTDDSGHDTPVKAVDCSSCHGDVAEIYRTSIHGQLLAMGDKDVPQCSSCHGKHDIFPAKDRRSKVNKFNLMYTCAGCHENPELKAKRKFPRPDAVPQFYESVHARGLINDGLIVAPSCNDCHGTHNIQVAESPASPIYRKNVYHTCGKCHTRVEEVYRQSIHGRLVESGDKRGPVCIDCHESHKIISPETIAYKQYSDQRCGHCHQDRLERYRETFHGKAMALGNTRVAACSDCHGQHDITPSSDPRSPINKANRLATCRKCHHNANINFAGYITHANHLDDKNYPQLFYTFLAMTLLLVGVFAFFGLHTVLWVVRSVALFLRDSKTFREAKIKVRKDDLVYSRFKPLERFLHILLIVGFTTLVLTGIPLKFYYTPWAGDLMRLLGGVTNAGYLHRFAALTLIMIFLIHLVTLVRNFLPRLKSMRNPDTGKFSAQVFIRYFFRPDSMMPGWQDVKDFWDHQKWFFGQGPKPRFERWTYWEKFDYFAVFWGVVFIGISGLVLWFPNVFTSLLPGWVINVALIIHSDEALLAAGFIFTFHFFNVHFRIEKYPMDTVIFSGKISKTELLEERGRWFERMFREGKLETLRAGDEWEGWKPIAKTFGFIAFGIGALLAVAIYTAMFIRLISP